MTERVERRFEVGCRPRQVFDAAADPDMVVRRSSLTGRSRLVEHVVQIPPGMRDTPTGSEQLHGSYPAHVFLQVATDIPLDWVPSALRSGLGAHPKVVRREEWELLAEDRLVGTSTFHVTDAAARGTGRTELTWTDAGGLIVAHLEVRVSLPLVGRVVERAIAPQLERGLEQEVGFYDALA